MVEVRVVEIIRCAPDELLELVMDVERYQYVNSGIRPIRWVRRTGDRTDFAFSAFAAAKMTNRAAAKMTNRAAAKMTNRAAAKMSRRADSALARAIGPKIVLEMRRIAGYRIDIRLAGPPCNRLMRAFGELQGGFVCVEVDGGTQLTRTMRLGFKAWARWFAEPILRKRLPPVIREEVELAKEFLESSWLLGTA